MEEKSDMVKDKSVEIKTIAENASEKEQRRPKRADGKLIGGVEEGQEEARDPLRRRPAAKPTPEEVRIHGATHLPFRE